MGIGPLAGLATALLLAACGTPDRVEAPPAPQPQIQTEVPAAPPIDGRVVVEAGEYPWSAIGRVNTGGRGYCTGILIGPNQVLASAPCLYNAIEGRWWHRSEVHFVAGYQRDTYQGDSAVANYRIAPGYTAGGGPTLANLIDNWAVVVLAEPIGRRTGWLGLQKLDQTARNRIVDGDLLVLPVGYRRGRAHAITLNLGCGLAGLAAGSSGTGTNCEVLPYDAALPPLAFSNGTFRALGAQLPDSDDALRGDDAFSRALVDAGLRSTEGRPPAPGGPVSALPLATIDQFLGYLGYLPPAADRDSRDAERRAAIRAFQSRTGLPVDGRAGVALLGHLIRAAQPAPAISQLDPPAGARVPRRCSRCRA